MNIHYFQHAPFEALGSIADWVASHKYNLTATKFFESTETPDVHDIDVLIIMGGPFNIYEEETYPWLKIEKAYIKQAIEAGKIVVGVCLGAQLIADVLGSKIYPNAHKEIGWFPLQVTTPTHPLVQDLPSELMAFHWHGDTFDLPKGAVHLFQTPVCQHQGYLVDNRILGLQFHFEMTPSSLEAIIENCRKEMVDAPYIQTKAHILKHQAYTKQANQWLAELLDKLVAN